MIDKAKQASFEAQVMREIEKQSSAGARFPCPVTLDMMGGNTPARAVLEKVAGREINQIDVCRSIKKLVSDDKLVFVRRWGYTWVVPADRTWLYNKEETASDPGSDFFGGIDLVTSNHISSWDQLATA